MLQENFPQLCHQGSKVVKGFKCFKWLKLVHKINQILPKYNKQNLVYIWNLLIFNCVNSLYALLYISIFYK